jgi:hypothetical protein
MARLKAGDRVSCKLKESNVSNPYDSFDDIKTFEIISVDHNCNGYYLYIPPYVFVKDSKKVDNYNYRKFGINPKYIGDDYIFIEEKMVYQVSFVLEGACCSRCQEFSDYVQDAKEDWLCWSCVAYPYR